MESMREPNCRRRWRATLVVAIHLLASSPHAASASCPTSEWIDPDTPASACARKLDHKGRPLELVFSDEFNVGGRSFRDGDDPVWTAIATFPSTNLQENGYSDASQYATTRGGKLVLNINNEMSHQEVYNSTSGKWLQSIRPYTSSMLQSWNKFCFTGGVVEISARMPGQAHQEGLWPAFWLMGNLGRATFQNSTDFLWPFSYAQCPAPENAEANSNPRRDQKINECLGSNWTKRFGLNPNEGRGAIEIDIFEVRPGASQTSYFRDKVITEKCPKIEADMSLWNFFEIQRPEILNTLQMGPGIPLGADQRPPPECMPEWKDQWYTDLKPGNTVVYGPQTSLELNWGTYNSKVNLQTDSIGATSPLEEDAFLNQHIYRLDWDNREDGYLRWTMDAGGITKPMYHLPNQIWQRSMNVTKEGKPFGTLLSRKALQEPVYMLLNIDISTVWGWDLPCDTEHCDCCVDCSDERCFVCLVGGQNQREWLRELCQTLPATMEIDFIRVYQQEGANQTSCSPPETPTEGWIDTHHSKYIDSSTDEPLRPVFAGGAGCAKDEECSGDDWPQVQRGKCAEGMCQCGADWTGPRCRARKIGAAAACAPLEEVVIGGGVCTLNESSTALQCGPGGTCVKSLPWDSVRRWTTLKHNGSTQLVGGGEGRCRCHRRWAGPYCQRRLAEDESRRCTPDSGLSSEHLHNLIKKICTPSSTGILQWEPPMKSLEQACKDVLWSPHWEEGGRFSKCGAWPRASWLLQAMENDTGLCCSKLSPQGDLSCSEQPYSFILLLCFGVGILVASACIGSAVQTHLRGGLCGSKSRRMLEPHKSFLEDGEEEDTEEKRDSDELSSEAE